MIKTKLARTIEKQRKLLSGITNLQHELSENTSQLLSENNRLEAVKEMIESNQSEIMSTVKQNETVLSNLAKILGDE